MSITPIDPLEKYIETLRQSTASQQANEKATTTKFYDDQVNTVRDLYSGEVNKVGQAYADQERQNSIQKLINERAVAERAENLGLTDSGLNRTQQTAVQLSYANNQSKIAQQKQAAIDSLNSQMTAKIAELEGNKSAALAGIDSEYEKLIHDNAVSARNADLDSYNKLVEAQNDAIAKRQADIRDAKKYVLDYEGDKAEAIYNATNLYNLGKEEILDILSIANISETAYREWWQENTVEGRTATNAARVANSTRNKAQNMNKVNQEPKSASFTGKASPMPVMSDKNIAINYLRERGVPANYTKNILTQDEWNRQKQSNSTSAAIKGYRTYGEYLQEYTEYLLEMYAQ